LVIFTPLEISPEPLKPGAEIFTIGSKMMGLSFEPLVAGSLIDPRGGPKHGLNFGISKSHSEGPNGGRISS